MTSYNINFECGAQKSFKKMNPQQAWIIMSWIKKNLVGTDDPRRHGKGLVSNRSGEWRYRIGDYRLIIDIQDEKVVILILEIGHRRDIRKSGIQYTTVRRSKSRQIVLSHHLN